MMDNKCVNCGYEEALHHGDTMQCPKGGEAPINKKQEWLNTVYQEAVYKPCEDCSSTAERDSLKEQLRKAQENKEEIHASYLKAMDKMEVERKKAEADKAEAVRIAIKLIKRECRGCEFAYQCEDMRRSNCFSTEVNTLESLTGKKWEEMSR